MKAHGRIPVKWGSLWVALGFLATGATLGLAEEVVLTTYFPSPRGIYEELRTVLMRFHDNANPPNILWQWRVSTPDMALRLERTNAGGTPTAEHLTVTTAGNVGIGTAAPVSILHLHGNYNNTGAGGFLLDATDVPSDPERYVLRINPFVVGGGMVGYQFQTKSLVGGTQVPLTFDHAGNVGIGTTSPGTRLHIAGDANTLLRIDGTAAAFVRLQDTGGGVNSKLFDIINDGGLLLFRALNDGAATIKGERLVIDQNGNVGINTTTPAQRLDVAGDVRWSGTLQGGTVPWARLSNFPGGCPSGQAVVAIGGALTCGRPEAVYAVP